MSFKKEDIEKIYNTIRVKHNTGKNAAYIPELKGVDPDIYAISICDVQGNVMNVGDYNKKVAIESVSKVFSLILALNKYNVETLLEKIGSSDEIRSFNSLEDVLKIKSHTINSFVNAGAMATTSLLYDKNRPDKENRKHIDIFFTTAQQIFNSILFNFKMFDIGAIPVLFPKKIITNIDNLPNEFSIELYIYLQAKKMKCIEIRFPVLFFQRENGKSSWNNGLISKFKQSKRIFINSLKIKLNKKVK